MATLSDVCTLIVDCEHKTAPKSDDGWPLVRTTDIGRGRLDLSNVQRVDANAYEEWTKRATPQPGDLILAREAPVGNVAIVTPGLEPVLGQRTVLIRPDPDKVSPDFLTYRLLAPDLQYWMQGVANGATVPHLNMEDIRALPLPPMPPVAIQRTIGAAIAAFDDLIENNRRRVEILEEVARLIYREWFVRFRFPGHENVELVDSDLGPIPAGWSVEALSDAADLVMGQSPKSEFYNESRDGLPFHQGVTDFGRRYPEHRKWCTQENRIAQEGDILLSVRAPVGRVNVAPDRMVIGRGLAALRSKRDIQVFLWELLREVFAVEDSMGGGTIFKAITKRDLQRVPVPRPDPELVESFEQAVGPMFELVRNLTFQNRVLREVRDLLLPRLVSGELDVSELDLELAELG